MTDNESSSPVKESVVKRLAASRGALIAIAAVSAVLIIGAVIGGVYFAQHGLPLGDRTPTPLPSPTQNPIFKITPPPVTPPPSLSELATQYPKYADVLSDPELDSVYKEFVLAYNEGGTDAAIALARRRGILNDKDQVVLTLELDTTDTADIQKQLEDRGLIITAASGKAIDVAIPLAAIQKALESDDPASVFTDLTALDHVVRVRLPLPPVQGEVSLSEDFASGVIGEGVAVTGADKWHEAGITGAGVKVGVLDMGFDGYQDLLGTELPERVTARSFISGTEIDQVGEVHGTAVTEIVHEMAPGADLYLAAFQTNTEKEQAVDWLLSQGVDIITTSTSSIYGPIDGTGYQAQYVDAVAARGVLWLNSAGNSAESHYRGKFTDKDANALHEFAPGDETMGIAPYGGRTVIVLNWDDWAAGSEDYNLYMLDTDGNVIASSENTQSGGDDAAEAIVYDFPGDGSIYLLVIQAVNITRPATFDLYVNGAEIEYPVADHSICTPSDAQGAFTIGATNWLDDSLEPYSSQGPTSDGRIKPDIAGPDAVSSYSYREGFTGTSASTPHAAGAAALVLEAFPDYTPDQVREFLTSRALDLGPSGPDPEFGYGRLWMGEPETSGGVVTAPTDTPEAGIELTTEPGQPTQEQPVEPTRAPRPTRTPERETPSGGGLGDTEMMLLMLLCCVIGAGVVGLAGILLVVIILVARPKSKPKPRYSAPPPGAYRCPRCGANVHPQAPACPNCGQPLRQPPQPQPVYRCRHCGQPVAPGTPYCPYCRQQP